MSTPNVVAGPSGHWYAHDGDELIALPMTAGEQEPPPHPSTSRDYDGWYSPDLTEWEIHGVLVRLAELIPADHPQLWSRAELERAAARPR